ncbi:MAG: urease subunit beta [Clostridiales Family XIII bacterium]|jgi:urease beta subunit|nr:urease subunit beta [Clostridiales Family XIII bacterium]
MSGKIGDFVLAETPVVINRNRAFSEITVRNGGKRMIQIGSHFHFFEVNRDLIFDREAAFGMHLDIPSGTSTRWLPGEEKSVRLCEYGGKQIVHGFNGLVNGCVKDDAVRKAAIEKARELGFIREGEA